MSQGKLTSKKLSLKRCPGCKYVAPPGTAIQNDADCPECGAILELITEDKNVTPKPPKTDKGA